MVSKPTGSGTIRALVIVFLGCQFFVVPPLVVVLVNVSGSRAWRRQTPVRQVTRKVQIVIPSTEAQNRTVVYEPENADRSSHLASDTVHRLELGRCQGASRDVGSLVWAVSPKRGTAIRSSSSQLVLATSRGPGEAQGRSVATSAIQLSDGRAVELLIERDAPGGMHPVWASGLLHTPGQGATRDAVHQLLKSWDDQNHVWRNNVAQFVWAGTETARPTWVSAALPNTTECHALAVGTRVVMVACEDKTAACTGGCPRLVALDRASGATLWVNGPRDTTRGWEMPVAVFNASSNAETDACGNFKPSVVVVEAGGAEIAVVCTALQPRCWELELSAYDMTTGQRMWQSTWRRSERNLRPRVVATGAAHVLVVSTATQGDCCEQAAAASRGGCGDDCELSEWEVRAVGARDGRVVWDRSAAPGRGGMAIGDELLVTFDLERSGTAWRMAALSPQTGKRIWQRRLPAWAAVQVQQSPAAAAMKTPRQVKRRQRGGGGTLPPPLAVRPLAAVRGDSVYVLSGPELTQHAAASGFQEKLARVSGIEPGGQKCLHQAQELVVDGAGAVAVVVFGGTGVAAVSTGRESGAESAGEVLVRDADAFDGPVAAFLLQQQRAGSADALAVQDAHRVCPDSLVSSPRCSWLPLVPGGS